MYDIDPLFRESKFAEKVKMRTRVHRTLKPS